MRRKSKYQFRYNKYGRVVPSNDADGWLIEDIIGSNYVTFIKREAYKAVRQGFKVRAFDLHKKDLTKADLD